MRMCPTCSKPMEHDERYVNFASGNSPTKTLSIKIRAVWCRNSACVDTTEIELCPTKVAKMDGPLLAAQ